MGLCVCVGACVCGAVAFMMSYVTYNNLEELENRCIANQCNKDTIDKETTGKNKK